MSDKDAKAEANKTPAAVAASALQKASAPDKPDVKVQPPEPLVIPANACKLEEWARARHWVDFPIGTTDEDIARSSFWSLVCRNLKEFDLIDGVTLDRTRMYHCMVNEVGIGYADVCVLWSKKIPPRRPVGESRIPDGYQIRPSNPGEQGGFIVTRLKDGVQLNAGHHHVRFEDARRFLEDHASVRGPNAGPRYFAR
ncbi:hypothetical protein SBBP2_890030 [Burkholderiales bacterium]|jgi:hypothetical protein|nr:hypothetical protein SBBP2_890030 [Burkholderiales bacterium]